MNAKPLYFDTGETPGEEMIAPNLKLHCPRPSIAILVQDGIKISVKCKEIIGDIVLQHGSTLVKAEIDNFQGEVITEHQGNGEP